MANLGLFNTPRPNRRSVDPSYLAKILSGPEVARQQGKTALFEQIGRLPGEVISSIEKFQDLRRRKDEELRQRQAFALDLEQKRQQVADAGKDALPTEQVAPALVVSFPELKGVPFGQARHLLSGLSASKRQQAAPSELDISLKKERLRKMQQPKPLSETSQKGIENLRSGLGSISRALDILSKRPTLYRKALNLGGALTIGDPEAQRLRNDLLDISDIKTRRRTGAALNREELQIYNEVTARLLDNPETVVENLKLLVPLMIKAYNEIASGKRPELLEEETEKTTAPESFGFE